MKTFQIAGQSYSVRRLVLYALLLVFAYISNTLAPASSSPSKPRIAEVTKDASSSSTVAHTSQLSRVIRVVDGDTIEIEGGQKVRYIGINTPESVDPRRSVQCFGKEASEENKRLVDGKMVRLESDISETDKYGRLLRYVYVDNMFINETLVRKGFAQVSTYPPDVKYASLFAEAEQEAKNTSLGLWASCPLKKP